MFHNEQPIIVKDEFATFRHKALTHHEARITHDDDPIVFKWHFQKGMLDKRMSGLELKMFIVDHMVGILHCGLLKAFETDNDETKARHQKIEKEFSDFLVRIVKMPKEQLDEILPWFQVEYRQEEDDLITLNASEMAIHSKRVLYSY